MVLMRKPSDSYRDLTSVIMLSMSVRLASLISPRLLLKMRCVVATRIIWLDCVESLIVKVSRFIILRAVMTPTYCLL